MAETERYALISRWLHWLTALVVLCLIPVGLILGELPDGAIKNQLYMMHKSFGLIVLALMLTRVAARMILGVPAADPDLSPFQRVVSSLVHVALYLLLLGLPVVGYLATAMCCAPVVLFDLITVPITVTGDKATIKALFTAHSIGGYVLSALILLHIAGGLFHHLVLRDRVMGRMSLLGR